MRSEQLLRTTYQAFNDRDEQAALAGLHADVRWDDGKGHMLAGKNAVAGHWREQWRQADTTIRIDSMEWRGPELMVSATLQFNGPNGQRSTRSIRNSVRFADDLIASMEIRV